MWIILSLLTAISVASHDAWIKFSLSDLDHYYMSAIPLVYSLPMFCIGLIFIPVPTLKEDFFFYFFLCLPINGLSLILYMKSIKISPLSLTIPYLAFTPAFILFTGYIFLKESPDSWGIIGVVLTCLGSYILNIDFKNKSLIAPFQVLFKEQGSIMMLTVAFLYSFTAVIGKKAIILSSPLFFGFSFFAVHNFIMIMLFVCFKKIKFDFLYIKRLSGLVAGLLVFFHIVFHSIAIELIKAAYMISIKRLSVLFTVIYGKMIFKEENFVVRFLGALFMLTGALIITFKGK
ncbi:MAG: DMT family transporter [Desulfobacterales bacterium]|nr:DMT family transporter [Desulfobacterales bacterium]